MLARTNHAGCHAIVSTRHAQHHQLPLACVLTLAASPSTAWIALFMTRAHLAELTPDTTTVQSLRVSNF